MSIPRRTHRLSKATLAEAEWAQSEANRLRVQVERVFGSANGSIARLEARVREHQAKLRDYRAQILAGRRYDDFRGDPLDMCIHAEWDRLKDALRILANDRQKLADLQSILAQWEGIVADIEGARVIFEQGKLT